MGLATTSEEPCNADWSSISEMNLVFVKIDAFIASAEASLRDGSNDSVGEFQKKVC